MPESLHSMPVYSMRRGLPPAARCDFGVNIIIYLILLFQSTGQLPPARTQLEPDFMSQSGAQSASPFAEASNNAPGYNLADVEVVLFSPVQNTRRVIRDAVHGAGFRRVNVVNSLDKLRRAVRETEFDMLVLEAKEHIEGVCEHIRDIRHGRLGKNPYLVITVITWKPDDTTIRKFVDVGADDIITMPISIGAVTHRVDHIVENRQKFIATSRYVGPDRRDPGRKQDPSDPGGFEVPNGVRFKATGDDSAKVDYEKIERANRIVREHRLRRSTLRFDHFAAKLERFIKQKPGESLPRKELAEMNELVGYIVRETEGDPRSEILELVGSLQKIMNEAAMDGHPEANLFALLRVHGEALLALLRGGEEAAELVVRAVFTAAKVIDKRSSKRKEAEAD
ncbi:MAG: hypothetical protein HOJ07_03405 [Rhodospirillaceae bacterium]|nr:hypothetical protein [Rhodospirillaceae bacterium]